MALPPIEAHLLCGALVAVDVVARAARMRLVLQTLGHRVSPRRLVAVALVGDAASSLTPFRAGGDVARAAALRRAGVPSSRLVLALAAEAVQTWSVILGGGAALVWLYGGAAWASFAGGLAELGHRISPAMIALVVLVSGALGAVLLRRLRSLPTRARARGAATRRPPMLPLLVTLPLTVVSIGARVLILPVLASTASGSLSFGAAALASFALLHSQMILPAPAGAGAVDLGFLAGVSGAEAGLLLVWWRLYTAGIGVAIGSALAAAALGRGAVSRRRASSAPARCRNARPFDTAFVGRRPGPPRPDCDCC